MDGQRRVDVHREVNGGVPGQRLSGLRRDAGLDHVRDKGVPQGVEIGVAPIVVLVGQKAGTLAALHLVLVLVLGGFFDPGCPSTLQVGLEHHACFLSLRPVAGPNRLAFRLRAQPRPQQRDQARVEGQHVLSSVL
jgi:hypothetical protein